MIFTLGSLLEHELTLRVENEDREAAMELASALVSGELFCGADFVIIFVYEDDELSGDGVNERG